MLGVRAPKRTSPFTEIDAIYRHILSQAEDWDGVMDVVAGRHMLLSTPNGTFIDLISPERDEKSDLCTILALLGYSRNDIESCVADLTALFRIDRVAFDLQLYHKSLLDFLFDPTRAGTFYIDKNEMACKFAVAHFKQMSDFASIFFGFMVLYHVTQPDTAVTTALQSFLPKTTGERRSNGTLLDHIASQFIAEFERLYSKSNAELSASIRTRWITWFRESAVHIP
ncbi:hypothetical protein D9619_012491 [Psilocybe cf. subviscida]|uniref:Uncharacterized protein n=1 Tax=Psilocybe cf. subviscida TaxID=2480587 RepID=A0A8H5ERB7_9AGAR|nr:hypothetical protein D9619_012491 [Psilocybe cf. subviscida]